jgi:hypothetical protein
MMRAFSLDGVSGGEPSSPLDHKNLPPPEH